jgi:3-hydroxybutyryl-CoA dehydratase
MDGGNFSGSLFFEDLQVGQTASVAKTITEADILLFAAVSTDTNPVHIDADAARRSRFGERIAHGMLSAGLISAVLGTRLPGPGTIYLSQTLKFLAPVKIGDTVTATAEVVALDPRRRRVTLHTVCTVGETVVIEGEALVMVPARAIPSIVTAAAAE